MVVAHDRRGGVVSERLENETLGTSTQSAPHPRRMWVAPTWERLETPMEVTMYAGRR